LGNTSVNQTDGLPSGSEFQVGTTTNTFEVMDGCNFVTTCSFEVTINQEPLVSSFSCPEDLEFIVPVGTTELLVNWPSPVGNTNCEVAPSAITQTGGPSSGSLLPVGVSQIEYTFNSGCETELMCNFNITVAVDSTTSNQDIDISQEIKLFPNPTSDLLNIEFGNLINEVSEIIIYNALGKRVTNFHQTDISDNLIQIRLDNFASSVYIASIRLKNGQQATKQFIVHHK